MSLFSHILLMDFTLMSDKTGKTKHQKIWIDFQTEENLLCFEGDSYDNLPDYLDDELPNNYSVEDIECERSPSKDEDMSKVKVIQVPFLLDEEDSDDSEHEENEEEDENSSDSE